MYDGIKSCFSVDGVSQNYLYSNIGARRGENWSPFLFTIFLMTLTFLSQSQNHKVIKLEENMLQFLKLFVLLQPTIRLSYLKNALDTYA